MNQVTASVETIYEDGAVCLTTRYTALCGCDWTVDMRGNVRRVQVCQACRMVTLDSERQMGFFD